VNIAIGYCLNQGESLNVFTGDPAVRIDNNLAEQEMKRVALGRKTFLLVGSPRGGQTAAILASILPARRDRRHGINPELYLTQLLANLPSTPITQVRQWLPDVWKSRQLTENKSVQVQAAV
jgi:pimeloyl-ACP methyl ester carboxylesterase